MNSPLVTIVHSKNIKPVSDVLTVNDDAIIEKGTQNLHQCTVSQDQIKCEIPLK